MVSSLSSVTVFRRLTVQIVVSGKTILREAVTTTSLPSKVSGMGGTITTASSRRRQNVSPVAEALALIAAVTDGGRVMENASAHLLVADSSSAIALIREIH